MARKGLTVGFLALGVATYACSQSDAVQDAGTDASGEGGSDAPNMLDATSDSSDAAGDSVSDSGPTDAAPDVDVQALCTSSLTNTAPPIAESNYLTTAMPPTSAATGGIIETGTYYLTEYRFYQGSIGFNTNNVHQWMYLIDATQGSIIELTYNSGQYPARAAGSYVLNGSTMSGPMTTCVDGGVGTAFTLNALYTYSAGSLRFYNFADDEEFVFAKQ